MAFPVPDRGGWKLTIMGFRAEFTTARSVSFIETRRDAQFDHAVDTAFRQLLEGREDLHCTCSDCYAHFTPGKKPWSVQPSLSCELSFSRTHPDVYQQYLQEQFSELPEFEEPEVEPEDEVDAFDFSLYAQLPERKLHE